MNFANLPEKQQLEEKKATRFPTSQESASSFSAEHLQPRSQPKSLEALLRCSELPAATPSPVWAGPLESTHLARGPQLHPLKPPSLGKWKGRVGGWGFSCECPLGGGGKTRTHPGARRGAGRRGAGRRGARPCPAPRGRPSPAPPACVSSRPPLPRAPRPRPLGRTRAASRRAGTGGGSRRPAPNLSDLGRRPGAAGAAGAAGARTAPLLRGPGPSCARRPRRAGRGRGDERRPRGCAPGWGGTRGRATGNWRSGEVGAAGRLPAPSGSAPRPLSLCHGRVRRVEAPQISAEEG